ncbi:DUF1353 domain-containing protein [Frankia sp. Cj5]|uniref:DUF1353 domain-containing protein n=1 Tax=Frankia sp. Cj5 TaxID=2880978 RepID=UPI001EF43B01|nr:DUF1353 domain-containing protein [Frankia sp. Cj5]
MPPLSVINQALSGKNGGAMPFVSCGVVVEELDEVRWRLLKAVVYQGNKQLFTVEKGFVTDFASVPQIFTWLIPRYGRYTKAAILHDWLWELADRGGIERADADGIFRRAMRELNVPFLRRWLMWGAVRLAATRKSGLSTLWRPGFSQLAAFIAVLVPGLLFIFIPGLIVLAALGVFYLAESIIFVILKINNSWRASEEPAKKINRPSFPWTSS